MRDPHEGVTADGMIRTGASRDAIAPTWTEVLDRARTAVAREASLYVYGSVANGTASVPTSDVDLLSIGLSTEAATDISAELSELFSTLCRAVSIAPASRADLDADGDAGYGLRVFVRHYCVHLGGDDPAADLCAHPADARAARGFNGDIDQHLSRWRSDLEDGAEPGRLGTRIARKTLLAVAGLVSIRDATWSTDRVTCAARWDRLEPDTSVRSLVTWLQRPPRRPDDVRRVLDGPVADVVTRFADEIGLWSR